jgi:hypothetical protein
VWWSGRGRGWDGGRGGRQAAVVHRVGSVDRVRGVTASKRHGVTASGRQASKRRSVQGASNSGWVGVGGVDGRPADDVWAPLISRWTLPPAARPCSHAAYKAASTRYYGALTVGTVWTVWTPFPSSFLFLLLFPFTHSHSLSLLVHPLLDFPLLSLAISVHSFARPSVLIAHSPACLFNPLR